MQNVKSTDENLKETKIIKENEYEIREKIIGNYVNKYRLIASYLPNIIKTHNKNEIFISVSIEGEEKICLVDTGAEISVLGSDSKDLWEKANALPVFRNINVKTGGGELHPGTIKKLKVNYDNETKYIQFVYAPSITVPIALGMNFLNAWNVHMVRIKNIINKCIKDDDNDNGNLDMREISIDDNRVVENEHGEIECTLVEKDKAKFDIR
jgi:hypothetical protein